MKLIKTAFFSAALLLSACASLPAPEVSFDEEAERARLIALNSDLARTQIVDRSPDLLLAHSTEDYLVLAPGGVVEGRARAIRGLQAWDVDDITLSGKRSSFMATSRL